MDSQDLAATHHRSAGLSAEVRPSTTGHLNRPVHWREDASPVGPLCLTDLISLDELQAMQDALSSAMGVASIITEPDGTPITRPSNFCRLCNDIIRRTDKGLCNCMKSDAALGRRNPDGPTVQPCLSGGLWDGGTSICVGEQHIANWLVGQVRDESLDLARMMNYAREIGADEDEFRAALDEVPSMPRAQFERICQYLHFTADLLSRQALLIHQQRDHIAELERAQREVKRSGLMLQCVLDTIPVRVFWKDQDLKYLGANRLFASDAGCDSPEDIAGLSDHDMPWRQYAEQYNRADRHVMASGHAEIGIEEKLAGANGETIWLNTSKVPLLDGDGEIMGVLGMFEDITPRKLAEKERAEYIARLARSNRELEQFASIASHDLQEPLRKIQAFADRLVSVARESLDDRSRDYLDRITGAAGRMRHLIDSLLSYSRVTTKAQPFEPVNLDTILAEVLGDLEVRIAESHARIDADELPTLEADPLQMRQLLQNLLGNALKFMPQGRAAKLCISCRPVDADPADAGEGLSVPSVKLTFRDNGIGFEQNYAERIFGVFQRLHGRREYEGSGMGLAICRKIVDRHRGRIWAESEPDKGTAFHILLPLRQPVGAEP